MFKSFYFLLNFENARKNYYEIRKLFYYFFNVRKEDAQCSQITPQFKVEIENMREAP